MEVIEAIDDGLSSVVEEGKGVGAWSMGLWVGLGHLTHPNQGHVKAWQDPPLPG